MIRAAWAAVLLVVIPLSGCLPPPGRLLRAGMGGRATARRLPPRSPMPVQAVPVAPDLQYWRDAVAQLDAKLPDLQLPSRRLVFIGDSITASWDPGLFSHFYGRAGAPCCSGSAAISHRACWPGCLRNGARCVRASWSC